MAVGPSGMSSTRWVEPAAKIADHIASLAELNEKARERVTLESGLRGALEKRQLDLHYQPIGFIDDDASKVGKRIHGLPVLGGRQTLQDMAAAGRVDEILIAIPSLPELERRRLMEFCEETGTRYRVMQSLGKTVLG